MEWKGTKFMRLKMNTKTFPAAPGVHPGSRVQPAPLARRGGLAFVPAARIGRLADDRYLLHDEHRRDVVFRGLQVREHGNRTD